MLSFYRTRHNKCMKFSPTSLRRSGKLANSCLLLSNDLYSFMWSLRNVSARPEHWRKSIAAPERMRCVYWSYQELLANQLWDAQQMGGRWAIRSDLHCCVGRVRGECPARGHAIPLLCPVYILAIIWGKLNLKVPILNNHCLKIFISW